MKTVEEIMALADAYADKHAMYRCEYVDNTPAAQFIKTTKQTVEARAALLAALQERGEPVGEVSGNDWSSAILYRDLEPGSPVYAAPQPAQPVAQPLSDEYCTRIYNEANNITVKNPPLTTARIFAAMRMAHGIGAKEQANGMGRTIHDVGGSAGVSGIGAKE